MLSKWVEATCYSAYWDVLSLEFGVWSMTWLFKYMWSPSFCLTCMFLYHECSETLTFCSHLVGPSFNQGSCCSWRWLVPGLLVWRELMLMVLLNERWMVCISVNPSGKNWKCLISAIYHMCRCTVFCMVHVSKLTSCLEASLSKTCCFQD
jgi:hypothetical protein